MRRGSVEAMSSPRRRGRHAGRGRRPADIEPPLGRQLVQIVWRCSTHREVPVLRVCRYTYEGSDDEPFRWKFPTENVLFYGDDESGGVSARCTVRGCSTDLRLKWGTLRTAIDRLYVEAISEEGIGVRRRADRFA